jgi:rhodanese-related sulfurtransferase
MAYVSPPPAYLPPDCLLERLEKGEQSLVIDVRRKEEFEAFGSLPGAVNLPSTYDFD